MFGALGRRAGGLGVLPGGAGGLVPLILPGWLHPATNFVRASAAAFFRSTDVALVEVGDNVPRFDPALGLLIEGQRTNFIRNPRAEGAVPGAPGAAPINWGFGGTATGANGLAVSIIDVGVDRGIPYITVGISGTSTTTVGNALNFETSTGIAAASGATWRSSFFVMLAPDFSHVLPPEFFLSHRILAHGSASIDQLGWNITPTSSWQPVSATRTMPAATTSMQPRFRWACSATGIVVSTRLRFALPQAEIAAFSSSPILAAIDTPNATTRLMDAPTWAASALGIPASGACTVSGVVNIPTISANHTIWQMDDGTNANRVMLRIEAGGALRLWRVLAGVTSFAALGTATDEVPLRWAVSVAGDGTASAAVNGGAEVTVTGGPTAGMTVLRGGHAVGTESLQGYLTRLAYSPRPIPAADLPALSRRGVADLVSMREIIQWP